MVRISRGGRGCRGDREGRELLSSNVSPPAQEQLASTDNFVTRTVLRGKEEKFKTDLLLITNAIDQGLSH